MSVEVGQTSAEKVAQKPLVGKTKERPTKVISITSGKGGVGKTNTTVNLGLALAKLGKRVLLLDGDLGLANIDIMLGFQPKGTLHDVISGKTALQDIIVSHSLGFDILPAASGIPEVTSLTELEKLALVSAFDDLSNSYDYMLVDTAAGIGSNVLYFNVASEEVLVVIDQEPTTITDAYALIKVLSKRSGVREFQVVVNRTPLGTDGRSIYDQLARVCGKFLNVRLKYLGAVAEDESVVEAVVKQRPYLDLFPSTKASRDISRLARKLDSEAVPRNPNGGLQFFFRELLEYQ